MATAPGGDHSPAPRSSPPRPSPLRQSQPRSQVSITIRDQPDGRGGGPSAEAKLPGGCGAAGVSSVRCCVSYGSGLRGTAPVRTAAHCGAPLPAAPHRSVRQRIAGHRSLRHRTGPYGSVLTGTAPSGAAAPAPGGAMMACAELLAVCLLSADRGPAPRRQPLPIFHDIFRRADKNDDGKLSFEEFKNYFADGILSSEELWELFSGIDRRHSDNVDTEKLCDYFSAYLGEYRNVLSALEALNSAVLAAMDKTKLVRYVGWINGVSSLVSP
ncbi:hypothetical protein Q9233_011509 [Columba guinea]|nr:hypothetical protein Q9233_011509 [Columba guinea]